MDGNRYRGNSAENSRAPGGALEAATQTSLNKMPASTENVGLETLDVKDISSHIADPLGENSLALQLA